MNENIPELSAGGGMGIAFALEAESAEREVGLPRLADEGAIERDRGVELQAGELKSTIHPKTEKA